MDENVMRNTWPVMEKSWIAEILESRKQHVVIDCLTEKGLVWPPSLPLWTPQSRQTSWRSRGHGRRNRKHDPIVSFGNPRHTLARSMAPRGQPCQLEVDLGAWCLQIKQELDRRSEDFGRFRVTVKLWIHFRKMSRTEDRMQNILIEIQLLQIYSK